ncbi:hypothetical protein EOA33_28515 [Mesorhizobium sp. M4A.F.Ca.ET.050.02.1.1]|uniref:hypothetical protein n=1 Tax=unclassified Mesorhizobium TaxID=325217 RepID=UPI000FCA8F8B|nr:MULTISPECIES: hypothetical protein [unclassified Mesorhizobium]RUX43762.1 hypothetical protein EOA33_28515 [Mesorhizobium sp. M4A.F.Ca.ET.050.02.1.1]
MTINIGKTVFSASARICRMAAAMALLSAGLAAGGCSTSNTTNAAPVAGVEGPKDTGSYPNLNIPPQVAAKQLTKEETDAKLAQLKGEQQAQLAKSGGGDQTASPAALNSLAKNHGDQALKQIETKCDPALDPSCN